MRVKWALVTRLTISRDVQEQNGSTRVSLSRSTMMVMMHPSGLSRLLLYIYIYYNSALARPFSRYLQKRRTNHNLSSLFIRLSISSANRIHANFTWFMSRRWLIFPGRNVISELVFLLAHRLMNFERLPNIYVTTCHRISCIILDSPRNIIFELLLILLGSVWNIYSVRLDSDSWYLNVDRLLRQWYNSKIGIPGGKNKFRIAIGKYRNITLKFETHNLETYFIMIPSNDCFFILMIQKFLSFNYIIAMKSSEIIPLKMLINF